MSAPEPQRRGACTCAPETGPEACVCAWGDLMRKMQVMGYSANAHDRATMLPTLLAECNRVLPLARANAVIDAAKAWTGTQEMLARVLGISAGRVRQLTGRTRVG